MSDETSVVRHIWLSLSGLCTLFRLNSGSGWIGKGKATRKQDGSVVVPFARPIALGLSFPNTKTVSGQSDLLGWTERIITSDMVGQKIAQFTSVEAKSSSGGRIGKDQLQWQENVNKAGGIAIIANSPEQAKKLISDYLNGTTTK